jgi:2-dehydro-3-deoxygluconokinase
MAMGKVVTLGEIMLRLSTDEGCRIPQSSHFEAHYGGGEANVAISLANYGHEAVFASKVPENALGHSVKKHLQSYGVGTEHLLTGGPRLGTYYMEAGVGIRSASVIYDRANSSFAMMDQVEWDLPNLFRDTDIFHVSGITPALSEKWQEMTIELVKAAKQANCLVSFDVNYRGKLWTQKEAGEVIQKILPYVDICSAGELDARYLLGIEEAPEAEKNPLEYYYRKIQEKYPTIQVMYSTKREVLSASANQLKGTLWMEKKYTESQTHTIEPIVDRVGGGDAFSGGVLHGLLSKMTPQEIIDFATAASALKHTIHGDCNQFSQKEVADFLANGSGKIIR